MFIIEGSDNLGKSTFAKKVTKHVQEYHHSPAFYTHMTRPPECFNFCSDYMDMMSYFGVQDRFHLGALAYHKNALTPEKQVIVEGELLRRGSYIFVMFAECDRWYRDQLEESKRDQVIPNLKMPYEELIDMLVSANTRFREMVCRHEVYFDDYFMANKDQPYPNDTDAILLSQRWMNRIIELQKGGLIPWRK